MELETRMLNKIISTEIKVLLARITCVLFRYKQPKAILKPIFNT